VVSGLVRAPGLARYEIYVRIVVDGPGALTGAEAVFTAARPRGLNRTNHDESIERRGPDPLGDGHPEVGDGDAALGEADLGVLDQVADGGVVVRCDLFLLLVLPVVDAG
jgi:hypothetical protein